MAERLQVFLNRKHVGEITLDGAEDRYGLTYASTWIAEHGFPVSPHVQLADCKPESVRRFLANLLPEGKWLEELAVTTHISRANTFGLISAIGTETTGALTFRMGDSSLAPESTSFRPIAVQELTGRIINRREQSISLWDGKPRLSVAGVQDKLPLLIMPDGSMGFGEGELASTHILKFGTSPDMHLVVNEFLCMELARLVKLPVAEATLARIGEPVLMVKRFDRQWVDSGQVNRLHLIDGCQMLDLPPTYKYERPFGKGGDAAVIRSGVTLPALFAACRLCRVPAAALRNLLNWVLFQLLIGNSDAHGKNISFFVGPGGIDLAPAYDLVCLDMYGDTYDRDLAMAIGTSFKPDDIMTYQLAEMCEECKLPQRQVARSLTMLCQNLLGQLDHLVRSVPLTDDEISFKAVLVDKIRVNTGNYLEYARELPRVVL
jgi:serine/threonine-protein kinase HipA